MSQKISKYVTEECPTQCYRCKRFYSGASCLTYEPEFYPKRILKNYCEECFEWLVKSVEFP